MTLRSTSEPVPHRARRPELVLAAVMLGGAFLSFAACMTLDAGAPARTAGTAPPPASAPHPAMPERTGRLRVVPERIDFEPVELGREATARLMLENAGWGPLRIGGVSIGAGHSFSISGDGCTGRTLRPREECPLDVRFEPRDPGRVSAILRVTSSDPARPHADLRVTGAASAPRHGSVSLRPAQIPFGEVEVGRNRILEAEIANPGRSPLRVRAASAGPGGFRIVADLCSRGALAPGSACRIAVRFSPPGAGVFAGTLRVLSDDPDRPEVTADLSGSGVLARLRCPQQRTAPLGGTLETRLRGTLSRGDCLTYAVRVEAEGRLVVCVPPGYTLAAEGFELVKGGDCRPAERDPPYRMYRSRRLAEGTDVDDLTITRHDEAAPDFTVLLRLEPRRPGRNDD